MSYKHHLILCSVDGIDDLNLLNGLRDQELSGLVKCIQLVLRLFDLGLHLLGRLGVRLDYLNLRRLVVAYSVDDISRPDEDPLGSRLGCSLDLLLRSLLNVGVVMVDRDGGLNLILGLECLHELAGGAREHHS